MQGIELDGGIAPFAAEGAANKFAFRRYVEIGIMKVMIAGQDVDRVFVGCADGRRRIQQDACSSAVIAAAMAPHLLCRRFQDAKSQT